MPVLDREPWTLDPDDLDEWYQTNVQEGSSEFAEDCRRVMEKMTVFLHGYPGLNVKEVYKAGSVGKGTMYADGSDLDCVVFVNKIQPLSKVKNTGHYRRKILRRHLEKLAAALNTQEYVVRAWKPKGNNLHLKVKTNLNGTSMSMDILITADNLAFQAPDDAYETMMKMQDEQRRIYHSCLTTLQIDFVKKIPGSVKEVIRLVKYWKAHYLKERWTGMSRYIPSSYCFELLTIYAWQNAGSPRQFDLGEGFKKVLTILASSMSTLKHYWTDNYTSDMAERGIDCNRCRRYKERPILLDPANPTNNVFSWYNEGIPELSRIAHETLQTRLLRRM